MLAKVKTGQTATGARKKFIGSKAFWCYIMIALPVIGFLVFQVYPILWTFKWSFFSYYGADETARFIGLENFKTFFTRDLAYWEAWVNTLTFALIKIPIEITLAMLIALVLNKRMKGTGFFRAMYFLPNIISVAIVGLILSNLFSYNGFINSILVKTEIIGENLDWFSSRGHAITMIVAGSIWSTFGVNVMYILAALATVPEEVYESARIDGASSARQFFSITIPLIAPVFQTILLMSIVGTLSINEYIIVLTNGGPHGSTHSVMSYLYTQFVPGFADSSNPQLGYGCAMSLITTILFALIAIFYDRFSNRMKNLY